MKNLVPVAFLVAAGCAVMPQEPMCDPELETQLRSDIAEICKASSNAPMQGHEAERMVEERFQQVLERVPTLLSDPVGAAPAASEIKDALEDVKAVARGAPLPVVVAYYEDLWRSGQLSDRQAVIMLRLMQEIVAHVKKEERREG